MTPTHTIVPTSWNAVTLGQFVSIIHQGMEGAGEKELLKTLIPDVGRINVSEYDMLLDALKFTKDFAAAYAGPVPEILEIDGMAYEMPHHLSSETTIMQNWSLNEEIADNRFPDSHIDIAVNAVWALSIYLVPIITGVPYVDRKQALSIGKKVEDMPCTIALPLAAFFLNKWRNPTESGTAPSPGVSPNPVPKATPTRWYRRLTDFIRSTRRLS